MASIPPKIAFFGTPDFAVRILDVLERRDFTPAVIITAPDKPKGRKLVMTPPPVKLWAEKRERTVLQPMRLDQAFLDTLASHECDLFIVAAYGKIIPEALLALPAHGTLNVHPSLLPLLRGSSPIESAILEGLDETGVTIMVLDRELDHGPIIAQVRLPLDGTEKAGDLERALADMGAELLAESIPGWIESAITAEEQKHDDATFTKKIKKEDGLLDLATDPLTNWRKFRAYDMWPGTYFFATKKNGAQIRVVIKDAAFENGIFTVTRVIPEGKKEMPYEDFLRGL